MRFSGKRLALLVGGVSAAAGLLGAASFALFTSAANTQTDSFAAGTVILASGDKPGEANNAFCTPTGAQFQNLEPGDSGTCTYTLTYYGSLNAWVALSVYAISNGHVAAQAAGSQTVYGGDALLPDGSNDTNALHVTITDTKGFLSPVTIGSTQLPVTCSNASNETSPQTFALGTQEGPCTTGNVYMLVSNPNPCPTGSTNCTAGSNEAPYGSWYPGLSDTFTLTWSLPIAAGNEYQGSSATIVLNGEAVQASNNPLTSSGPACGWATSPGSNTACGSSASNSSST
jgi:hypothetical protein